MGAEAGVDAGDKDGRLKRRLAVILASDAAGYGRLVSQDEEGTIRRFADASRTMHALVVAHGGRVFNTAGDAILAEFDSAVLAVRAAISINESLNTNQTGIAADRRIVMRIGIAMGDVIVGDDGDLFGDAVIVAARLQALSDVGGVCISRDVHDLVSHKIHIDVVDLGPQHLKNLPNPIGAFRIASSEGRTSSRTPFIAPLTFMQTATRTRKGQLTAGAIAIACLAGLFMFFSGRSEDVVLLPPQKVHFRSYSPAPIRPDDPAGTPPWTETPTTITWMPVAFSHRTEPGRRARILRETMDVAYADLRLAYVGLYVVEITDALCGDRWYCIKGNVGPETLEPGRSISRETLFVPAVKQPATIEWRRFVTDTAEKADLTILVTYRAVVELPGWSKPRQVEMSYSCRIDVAQMHADLIEANLEPGKMPVYLQADCLP